MTRFLRFCVVGTVGFGVDSAVLYGLMALTGAGPLIARIPSFLCAATATWLLNRTWTFSDRRGKGRLRQWGVWALAMVLGALVNYAIFALIVLSLPPHSWTPLAGLAAGSLAGLAVNYTLARKLIFPSRA